MAIATGLWAPLGALIALATHRPIAHRAAIWIACWGGFIAVFALQGLLQGDPLRALLPMGLGASGLVASILLTTSRRRIALGFSIALLTLSAPILIERQARLTTWVQEGERFDRMAIGLLTGVQRLASPPLSPAVRNWQRPGDIDELVLRFDARLVEGASGWDWRAAEQFHNLQPGEQTPATTLYTPRGDQAFIFRRAQLAAGAAGHRFRATLALRAVERTCGSVSLTAQAWQFRTSTEVCSTPEWRSVETVWDVPSTVEAVTIDLVVSRFDRAIELRNARIEMLTADGWQDVGPLDPNGVAVAFGPLTAGGSHIDTLRFEPQRSWTSYALPLDGSHLATGASLAGAVRLERGLVVEFRNTSVTTGVGRPVLRPQLPSGTRYRWWFYHPNLAGHATSTLGIAAAAAGTPFWISAFLLSLMTTLATGSRAALAALLLAGIASASLLFRGRGRTVSTLLLLAVLTTGLLAALYVAAQRAQPMGNGGGVARVVIWRVGIHAFLDRPWTGIGGDSDDFLDYWRRRGPSSSPPVAHAHNLWLHFAASYGVPGLIAIVWLTATLIFVAWRRGRATGLVLVGSVLFMNLFDYTLFHSAVLLPLLLTLNSLPDHAARAGRAPPAQGR